MCVRKVENTKKLPTSEIGQCRYVNRVIILAGNHANSLAVRVTRKQFKKFPVLFRKSFKCEFMNECTICYSAYFAN